MVEFEEDELDQLGSRKKTINGVGHGSSRRESGMVCAKMRAERALGRVEVRRTGTQKSETRHRTDAVGR